MKSRISAILISAVLSLGGIQVSAQDAVQSADSLYNAFLENFASNGAMRQRAVSLGNQTFAALEDLTEERFTFAQDSLDFYKAKLDYWMAEYYYDNSDFRKALSQARYALEFCRETENEDLITDCLSILGISAIRTGDYNEALDASKETLELDVKNGDVGRISSSLNTLAGIYLSMKDYDSAKKYIDQALEIEKTIGVSSSLAVRYGMASEIYTGLEEYDAALDFAQKAYDLDMAAGRDDKAAIRLSQKGAVLLAMNNYKEAKSTLLKAGEIFERVGNVNSLAITLNQIGALAAKQGDYALCRESYLKAIEICQKTGNLMVESKAHKALADVFETRDLAFALTQLKLFVEDDQKLSQMENEEAAAKFNVLYETAKKDAQIELQDAKIRRKNAQLILLLVTLGVALFAVVQTILLARIKDKNKKILSEAGEISSRIDDITVDDDSNTIKEGLEKVSRQLSDLAGNAGNGILTRREKEIAVLSCEGLINKEIADRLGIGVRTVESHKANIYRKLEINNNSELVAYAYKVGLVSDRKQDKA